MLSSDIKANTHKFTWTTTGQQASYIGWTPSEPDLDVLEYSDTMCVTTDLSGWFINRCDLTYATLCEY
jgi:hypothetical protein